MTSPGLLNWMWQSTLLLGGGWLCYRALLRREACFGYNRGLLLLAPLLAAAAPLLPWHEWWPVAAVIRTVGVPYAVLPALRVAAPVATGPGWPLLLYAGGVLLSLGALVGRLGRLWQLARRLPARRHPGYTLRLTGGRLPTSSFGRTVFWDETAGLSPAEAAQVLAHERAHLRRGHSADQLWLQLWQAALWFNPFVYFCAADLALVHEYQADTDALRRSPAATPAGYGRLLARLALRPWAAPALLHAFTTSHTLNRIAMLNRTPFTRSWRRWAVLPVAATLLGLVACQQLQAFGPPPPPPPPPVPGVPPPPPAPPAEPFRHLPGISDRLPDQHGSTWRPGDATAPGC